MDTHLIPELDRKGLRDFGLTTGAIVAVLFGLFFPWLLESSIPVWPWIITGVLVTLAVVAPRSLNPIYRGWMRFGLLASRVMTPLIMSIIFFAIFAPVALLMRIIGRDPMRRDFDKSAETYRIASRKPSREKLEKPF